MPLTDDPWLPLADENGNIPAVRRGAIVVVYRFDGESTLTPLPNVECLSVEKREGTDPGSARFRYNLASGLDGAPVSIETALGTDFTGSLVVNSGDRLVVQGTRPDGSTENLFDGLAIAFGMGLDPEMEEVYLGAVGIAWHCWDDVIGGAIFRDAGNAQSLSDTPTQLPAQFNPEGLPNCSPDGYMAGSFSSGFDFRYPTFLDPLVVQKPDDLRTKWTLPKALRYIFYTENRDEEFVFNPDGAMLDALLVSPSDTGDTTGPIDCPDTPITGKDWPVTVNKLVSECGFGTSFDLTDDDSGLPMTTFNVFKQQGGPVKSLYLYPRGTPFSPTLFNVGSSGLSRDLGEVVNQWTVQGAPDRWEATFILKPLFPMNAADGTGLNPDNFRKSNPAITTTNRYTYRIYGIDECGEGYYQPGSNAAVVSPSTAFDKLFGKPDEDGTSKYAQRRRPPIGTLISLEKATGKPYEARLSISTDYDPAGTKVPGLWNGTSGTWQPVTSTTWRLLSDRLGIEITDEAPETWEIGKPTATGMPYPAGVVRAVSAQATSGAANFTLRLTCVVEADTCLEQVAIPGGNSPLAQTINRVIDASDRYRNDSIYSPSELYNAGVSGGPKKARDDTAAALAEAQAIRHGTEAGVLEGPVTIPRLTTYYKIGDRIDQFEGRNLGLRTDQGTGDPVYPVVVAVRHDFGPESQSTTIELSDAGTDRTKYDRHPARKAQRLPYVHPMRKRPVDSPGMLMGGGSGGTGGPGSGVLMGGGSGGMGGPPPGILMGGGSGGTAGAS